MFYVIFFLVNLITLYTHFSAYQKLVYVFNHVRPETELETRLFYKRGYSVENILAINLVLMLL